LPPLGKPALKAVKDGGKKVEFKAEGKEYRMPERGGDGLLTFTVKIEGRGKKTHLRVYLGFNA